MRDPEFFDDRDFFPDSEGEEIADVRGARRDIWQRLSQLMVACLFLLILAAILRIFWPEIERHRELAAEVHRLETIRDKRLERVAELQRRNEWMLTDREYLESVARDRLDMAHSDEVVVRIDRDSEAKALKIQRDRERAERERREAETAAKLAASGATPPATETPASVPPTAEAAMPTTEEPAVAERPRPAARATVVDLSEEEESP
jgi:cell division protein FtsB